MIPGTFSHLPFKWSPFRSVPSSQASAHFQSFSLSSAVPHFGIQAPRWLSGLAVGSPLRVRTQVLEHARPLPPSLFGKLLAGLILSCPGSTLKQLHLLGRGSRASPCGSGLSTLCVLQNPLGDPAPSFCFAALTEGRRGWAAFLSLSLPPTGLLIWSWDSRLCRHHVFF